MFKNGRGRAKISTLSVVTGFRLKLLSPRILGAAQSGTRLKGYFQFKFLFLKQTYKLQKLKVLISDFQKI